MKIRMKVHGTIFVLNGASEVSGNHILFWNLALRRGANSGREISTANGTVLLSPHQLCQKPSKR